MSDKLPWQPTLDLGEYFHPPVSLNQIWKNIIKIYLEYTWSIRIWRIDNLYMYHERRYFVILRAYLSFNLVVIWIQDIAAQKILPCMYLTFHVHERNHDSEKARFLHRQFQKVIKPLWVNQHSQNLARSFRRLLQTWQRKREVNWMFSDFFVNVLSYPCLKTVKVTKGPYLLEVPTSDFGFISLENGNKKAINLDITIVERSDKNFRSFL